MQDYEKTIFISYVWGGDREEIIDQIDQVVQNRGLKSTLDQRHLDYTGSMFELVKIAENKQPHNSIFLQLRTAK